MKNRFKFSAAIVSFVLCSSANASLITIETGFSAAGAQVDALAYQALVNSGAIPSPGYGSTTVPVYDNIANHSLFQAVRLPTLLSNRLLIFASRQTLAYGKFGQALISVTAGPFLSTASRRFLRPTHVSAT